MFPSEDAQEISSMTTDELKKIKRVVLIDSTWSQTKFYLRQDAIKNLKHIKIKTEKTVFGGTKKVKKTRVCQQLRPSISPLGTTKQPLTATKTWKSTSKTAESGTTSSIITPTISSSSRNVTRKVDLRTSRSEEYLVMWSTKRMMSAPRRNKTWKQVHGRTGKIRQLKNDKNALKKDNKKG